MSNHSISPPLHLAHRLNREVEDDGLLEVDRLGRAQFTGIDQANHFTNGFGRYGLFNQFAILPCGFDYLA